MTTTERKTARRGTGLSIDATLGAVGCCLAAASATFGVAMTIHGPLADLGKSGNFTVYAQLSKPRAQAAAANAIEDLDTTATASIPKRDDADATSERATLAGVTLASVTKDAATLVIDGRRQVVRIGDRVAGLGEVLSILPGRRPVVQTSRGLIISMQTP